MIDLRIDPELRRRPQLQFSQKYGWQKDSSVILHPSFAHHFSALFSVPVSCPINKHANAYLSDTTPGGLRRNNRISSSGSPKENTASGRPPC